MQKTLFWIFFVLAFCVVSFAATEDAQQTVSEFNLAGFGEKGKKTWEISGKSADIFTQNVKLTDIVGRLYGDEDITLTAKKGDLDKNKGNVHLEDDVVITTEEGATLTTSTLDWDRTNQSVSTKDRVNIVRDNLFVQAQGAIGQTDLKKVNLEKSVAVQITPAQNQTQPEGLKNKIIITCDGPLEIDYEKNIATFYNNVKVDQVDNQLYSDRMEVYFSRNNKAEPATQGSSTMLGGSQIEKIIAKGNVKIVRGENISYSDEAVYNNTDKKITLTGRPKLIIYSKEDLRAPSGN